jgi:hypothetical protein
MPLPNPNNGESQNDFMARCVVDPNIVNDFGTIDQRVAVCSNLFNPPKEEKAQSTDNWPDEFEKELTKAERTSIKDFTEFYKAEYNDAIDLFLRVKAMTSASAQGFFQDSKYVGMYEGMYSKIGLQFANWYSRNVEKYLPKADAGNMQSIWANAFAFMGNQVAGQRVTMVSSTAQATLTNTLRQFMSDPIFMSAGEKVQAKMLRQKFDGLADYQARRIVRTEATNAANYATEQAALNLFPGADMTKTWKSGYDARVRPAHQAANNQVVPFNSKFSVGGESLQRPGDPNGSASNVINCRCSMIVLPKAGANTIGPRITNIGFGMAQTQIVDAISPAVLAPEVIATVVAETAVVNAQIEAKTIKQAKAIAIDNFESNGLKIKKITVSRSIDVPKINELNAQLNALTNNYKIDSLYNTKYPIDLIYKSTSRSYGFIETTYGNTIRINFGDLVAPLESRTKVVSATEFIIRGKSAIDAVNQNIATLTHEFAHILATRHTLTNPALAQLTSEYYAELKIIQQNYIKEIAEYKATNNFVAFNTNYLGTYASKNIDEFMAEGFTEYKLSSNPSKFAIEIGKLIEKYFGK